MTLHSPTFSPTLCAGFSEHWWNDMIPMFDHQSRNINRLRLYGLASYKRNMPVGVTIVDANLPACGAVFTHRIKARIGVFAFFAALQPVSAPIAETLHHRLSAVMLPGFAGPPSRSPRDTFCPSWTESIRHMSPSIGDLLKTGNLPATPDKPGARKWCGRGTKSEHYLIVLCR